MKKLAQEKILSTYIQLKEQNPEVNHIIQDLGDFENIDQVIESYEQAAKD